MIQNKMVEDSVFNKLSKIKCNIEKKGKFNYISWAEAWKEVKKLYPKANYRVIPYIIKKIDNNIVIEKESLIHPISKEGGGFVKVSVIIDDIEHIEYYPILNNMNRSIKYDFINAFDVNTAIKRGLTKALSQFGLGLYVYNGEDLPEE